MRPVTAQSPAALQLLKTLLEALPSGGDGTVETAGSRPPVDGKGVQPPPPAPAPPPTTQLNPRPGFNKPAPGAANALAAQMLATVMAEREIALAALAETSGESDGRKPEGVGAIMEEPAPAQPRAGTPIGFIPWPTAALAAYSARPTDIIGLQPGARRSPTGAGGRSDPEAPS
jgi:hypothetical protein